MSFIKLTVSKAEFLFFREAVNEKFNSWMEEMDDAEEESNRPPRPNTFTLSPERVRAMKEAGFWDDPVKRDQMIRKFHQGDQGEVHKQVNEEFDEEYKKQKVELSAPIMLPKKLHWTQTPKGKIILAKRSAKNAKKAKK